MLYCEISCKNLFAPRFLILDSIVLASLMLSKDLKKIKTQSVALPVKPLWNALCLRMRSCKMSRVGMLVIRNRFRNYPVGIMLPDSEKLYVKDSWFEDILNSALVINNFVKPELQINLDNLKFSNAPFCMLFSGRAQGWSKEEVRMDFEAPSDRYAIQSFSHGLHIELVNGVKSGVDFTTKIEHYPIETM